MDQFNHLKMAFKFSIGGEECCDPSPTTTLAAVSVVAM